MHVHPAIQLDFRYRSGNLFEAFIKRIPTPEGEQPVFDIFPDIQEFSCGDLFSPHPQIWQYYGRIDDLLVFASGKVFHPAGVEKHITQHLEVVVVGTRQPQAALVVAMNPSEPWNSAKERSKAISRIWPRIMESNETCPVYAKISRRTTWYLLIRKSH